MTGMSFSCWNFGVSPASLTDPDSCVILVRKKWSPSDSPPARRASSISGAPGRPSSTGSTPATRRQIPPPDRGHRPEALRKPLPRRDPRRTCKWLGLDWDEEPLFQSRRFDVYRRRPRSSSPPARLTATVRPSSSRSKPAATVEYDDLIHGNISVETDDHQGPGPDQVGRLADLQLLPASSTTPTWGSPTSSAATTTSATRPSRSSFTRPSASSRPGSATCPSSSARTAPSSRSATAASPSRSTRRTAFFPRPWPTT